MIRASGFTAAGSLILALVAGATGGALVAGHGGHSGPPAVTFDQTASTAKSASPAKRAEAAAKRAEKAAARAEVAANSAAASARKAAPVATPEPTPMACVPEGSTSRLTESKGGVPWRYRDVTCHNGQSEYGPWVDLPESTPEPTPAGP